MWLNRVLRLAAVAMFGIGFGQVLSSHAQAQDLYRLPSPYGGSLTVEEQTASAAVRPALADANWNHEVCAISYNYENTPRDIAKARADVEKKLEAFFQQALINDMPKAQIEEKVKEATRVFEAEIKAAEKTAAPYLANIPKCRGQFFRPALESVCGKNYNGNRFCAQLDGDLLPGVELIEDKLEFAHGLSWNVVGHLFSQGTSFAPGPWSAAPARPLADPPRRLWLAIPDKDSVRKAEEAREVDLEAASRSGIAHISAVNNAVIGTSGKEMPNGFGQWAFSIGTERFAKYQVGQEVSVLAANLERETGVVGDLGEYWQLPNIHFQAFLYDVLVQSDSAHFAVEKVGGESVTLSGAYESGEARFQTVPRDGPAFGSSYSSYRIHALMTPSPDDVKAILDPQAAFLVASFEMLLEDGSIDVVTLRTPLAGIRDAWLQMNQDHQETKALIQQTAEEWDALIAEAKVLSPRTPAERQASALSKKSEAQTYIAANPFAQDCGYMPAVGSLSAASLNAQAGQVSECYRHWYPHAAKVKGVLGMFQRQYAQLGGTDSLIGDEIARWDAALAARAADLARFNAAVDAHNRDVGNRAAATPPPALARRQQSYKRRQAQRSSDGGRDYASEFFERQRNPPPPHFRPPPQPPRANGYMGTGYW